MKTDNFESKGQKEKRREREEHFLLERGGFVCWVDRDQMNELSDQSNVLKHGLFSKQYRSNPTIQMIYLFYDIYTNSYKVRNVLETLKSNFHGFV